MKARDKVRLETLRNIKKVFLEAKTAPGANAELHVYGDGKGPYELMSQTGETTTETWSSQMIQWLKSKGLFSK